jgi:hypothetical protein
VSIVALEWSWFLFAMVMEVILLVVLGGGTLLAYYAEQVQFADSPQSAHQASVPDRVTRAEAQETKNDSAATQRGAGVTSIGRNASPTAATRDGLALTSVTGEDNAQTLHVSGRPEHPTLAHLQQIAQLAPRAA